MIYNVIPLAPIQHFKLLKAENEYELTFFDWRCKEKLVQKMLDMIINECGAFQKSYEIILAVNNLVCEVMWVTNTMIDHTNLCEKTFNGGKYLKIDTCNRCPHIAQSVFSRILKDTELGEFFTSLPSMEQSKILNYIVPLKNETYIILLKIKNISR